MPTFPITPFPSLSNFTITNVLQRSEKSALTKSGLEVEAVWEVNFTGLWTSVGLIDSANIIGLDTYGDYIENLVTGNLSYAADITAALEDGSQSMTVGDGGVGMAIYSVKYTPITAERLDLSPLSRPVQIDGGGLDLTEVRRVDQNGNAIINPVGDYYEGLPNFYIEGGEITLTRNEASNPLSTAQSYSFSTNQDNWFGVAPYQGLFGKISFKKMFEQYQGAQVIYYSVTYPIRNRTDTNGWNFCPLAYGYRYYPQTGKPAVAFVDGGGVHGPCFLAANGTLLNPDGTAQPTTPAIFPAASGSGPAGYVTLKQQTWGTLGLPNPSSL
jgi:hypothetical protein